MATNFVNNFESANNVINNTKKARSDWHKQERTLSRLLKEAQLKNMLPYTKPLFAEVGLPTDGKLSRTAFLTYIVNFVEVKGEKLPAYLREVTIYKRGEDGKVLTDADGHRVAEKDEKGNVKTALRLTAIKEGTWTLEKLLRSVAK